MKTRNKAVPAVYIILEWEGKILIALRQNTGYQDNTYSLPSGHVEVGEFPKAALIREVWEEIGIKVAAEDLEFVHALYRTAKDEAGDYIDLFFRTRNWKGNVTNMEPRKCGELKWVSPTNLPENTIPYIQHTIQQIEQGILLSEL